METPSWVRTYLPTLAANKRTNKTIDYSPRPLQHTRTCGQSAHNARAPASSKFCVYTQHIRRDSTTRARTGDGGR